MHMWHDGIMVRASYQRLTDGEFDFQSFLSRSRVSTLMHDIDIAILFVRLSVCPSRSGIR